MGTIFSDIKEFGFDSIKESDIYIKKEEKDSLEKRKKNDSMVSEDQYLIPKTYTCKVCDTTFKEKVVRAGKARLLSTDYDLRPKYQGIDPLKYDAVVCPKCGYASLSRFFNKITYTQVKLVKENIAPVFKYQEDSEKIYTYDMAIKRYKLALVTAIHTKAKDSEKAYICLKIAWLYRGKRENLPDNLKDQTQVINSIKQEEMVFIKNAFEGFERAFSTESFPMCGMDQRTVEYLLSELAFLCDEEQVSLKLLSNILMAKDTSDRLKEKARGLKERWKEKKTETGVSKHS